MDVFAVAVYRCPVERSSTCRVTATNVGCVVFVALWAVWLWVRTLLFGGLANLHDTLSLYVMGFTAVTISSYMILPYSLLCQRVMQAMLPAISALADDLLSSGPR